MSTTIVGADEAPVAGPHPMITHVAAVPLVPELVAEIEASGLRAEDLPVFPALSVQPTA